jgi:hypothetical protein
MRLAVMNVPEKTSHNANLPVTIAKNGRIVNGFGYVTDEPVSYDQEIIDNVNDNIDHQFEVLTEEKQACVLFAKISNKIFTYSLKPKVIELYMVIALIIKTYPNIRFNYRDICVEYKKITRNNITKNTVTKYINILLGKGLLQKGKNKNYHLGVSIDIQDSEYNYYHEPKGFYTPFYSKIYENNLTKNEVILDHYIATLPYKRLRRTKVIKDVNISLSTYNNLLRSLRAKNIIYRNVLINKNIRFKKMFFYYSPMRDRLLRDYQDDKIIRFVDKRELIYESRVSKPIVHKSRYWFVGDMGDYMRKYKIKYIKAFDNYEIQDALDIIKELEKQNKIRMSAPLIVKAILEAWNWDRIVSRRHSQFKKINSKLAC